MPLLHALPAHFRQTGPPQSIPVSMLSITLSMQPIPPPVLLLPLLLDDPVNEQNPPLHAYPSMPPQGDPSLIDMMPGIPFEHVGALQGPMFIGRSVSSTTVMRFPDPSQTLL